MHDPRKTVENQHTEKAPKHGDELEQVHVEGVDERTYNEPSTEQVLNEAFEEIQDQDLRNEEGNDEAVTDENTQSVEVEGQDPGSHQPVYGDRYEEEFAQEAAVAPMNDTPMDNEEQETTMEDDDVKTGMGWLGLSAAILSFFFAPLILGAAGIILGIVSKRRGADTLGNMAIIVSIVSIAFSFFFTPFYNLI
ncbi:hypothetical protein SAMN05192559_102241 [Halobacillus karajensis]|uniref:DUF4190 domain-containing protein n=1 Tax=Halobacillus karajensis TaxID=195088 RepID=A0A024P6G0_9BACI|nr:DUF4190 domain-containing protein [Halobacillus karajensis]CDQ18018.1 hypothetical protein BN982_00263 [Halobacillus karajensis]CDQ24368.1 hypothetical protein BN983_02647 [Halobacillus karajensis]CDQ29384.1 hypothetical protein BN981_03760 [Halobacillus karajensis]SEH60851.1 hypothetical protein SAMN05192559_102241 [Halobacillus karajensis]